jgi:molybdenum cofactor cytidylyltransferase
VRGEGPAYVVLAAGAARRMGFDKAIEPLDGRSPLERVTSALGAREHVVVAPSRLGAAASRSAPRARVVSNDEPERGMTRSLQIGLQFVDRDRAFGVLPADLPEMTEATIAATEALLRADIDVAYPVDPNGVPGHPVLFAASARSVVDALPEGDTLRRARDHSSLRRATWLCSDPSAFFDVDEPADWDAATRNRAE